MATVRVTREELEAGIKVRTGERTTLIISAKAICASLMGAAFEKNKNFPLPQCLAGLNLVYRLAEQRSPASILVVGHADPTGEPTINDPLSLLRAESAAAWLRDDPQPWLDRYGSGVPQSQRWGEREDYLMIRSMPGFGAKGADSKDGAPEDPVRWYQRTRNLKADGIAGPQTRGTLITEYFALARGGSSETESSAEPGANSVEQLFDAEVIAHGSGENFPLATVKQVLAKKTGHRPLVKTLGTQEEQAEPLDRRFEFFFFDKREGVAPEPGTPDGPEYLQWVTQAGLRHEVIVEDTRTRLPLVEFEDVLFNTNSAVPLPGLSSNEADADEHGPSCLRGLARALQQNYANPGQSLHVAGHTDTTATASINDPLSQKRAEAVLALLLGKRDEFKDTAHETCVDADKEHVLQWASERFGFACSLSEHGGDKVKAVKAFQTAYNDSAERERAAQAELGVDGDFGPLTWGAVNDLYDDELALLLDGDAAETDAPEAGDDLELLRAYRADVRLADEKNAAKGYGERFPIEEKQRNNFRSKTNRRVEIVFFDKGEVPNLALPPDQSEVYDDALFRRTPLPSGRIEAQGIRYALLPTRFSNSKTFPKPSCFPLLRQIVEAVGSDESLRLVIVGHTDHDELNEENEKLGLARADAVKALLTHDLDFFKARFEEPDPIKQWDFEEVQWMLHALKDASGPFYVGDADGYPGDTTQSALAAFQLSTDTLAADTSCNEETLSELIQRYQALLPTVIDAERIETVSGGSWSPPLVGEAAEEVEASVSDDAEEDEFVSARNRRVELFVFERPVVPPSDTVDPSTRRTSPTYRAWSKRSGAVEPPAPISYAIRILDYNRAPVNTSACTILRHDRETDQLERFADAAVDASGNATVNLLPGTYRLEFEVDGRRLGFGLCPEVDATAGLCVMIDDFTRLSETLE